MIFITNFFHIVCIDICSVCSLASPLWRSAPRTTWLASQSPPSARPSGRSSMMRTGIEKRKSEDNPMVAHNGHNKLSTHVVCLVNSTDQRHKDWGQQTAKDSSTVLKMIGQLNKSLVLTFSLSLWSMLLLGRWCRALWWTTSNASLTMDPLDPDILISLSRSPSSLPSLPLMLILSFSFFQICKIWCHAIMQILRHQNLNPCSNFYKIRHCWCCWRRVPQKEEDCLCLLQQAGEMWVFNWWSFSKWLYSVCNWRDKN